MSHRELSQLVGRCVVLDTQGPVVYIGVLRALDEHGFVLVDADVHSRDEGHATNEQYINDVVLLERAGARNVNRRQVYVLASAVISVSALDDIIADGPSAHPGAWLK